jgi:hypothetical protein
MIEVGESESQKGEHAMIELNKIQVWECSRCRLTVGSICGFSTTHKKHQFSLVTQMLGEGGKAQ